MYCCGAVIYRNLCIFVAAVIYRTVCVSVVAVIGYGGGFGVVESQAEAVVSIMDETTPRSMMSIESSIDELGESRVNPLRGRAPGLLYMNNASAIRSDDCSASSVSTAFLLILT